MEGASERITVTPRTQRRICGVCGRPFAILIPEGGDETERDKLCGACQGLPAPPEPGEE